MVSRAPQGKFYLLEATYAAMRGFYFAAAEAESLRQLAEAVADRLRSGAGQSNSPRWSAVHSGSAHSLVAGALTVTTHGE